jgi:DNA helicase II / ATP-dependent DNA helicase PcrA
MAPSSLPSASGKTRFEAELNAPQAEAVAHVQGPLLVLAGAGSGKTRVITYRIAQLLTAHNVPPYRLLAVTFTNKAAGEMRARLERLVGPDIAHDLWVGTFHATCARLLRRFHDAVSLQRDFVIYDESDQRAVVARAVKALQIDDKAFPPKQLLAHIHRHKQEARGPQDIIPADRFDRIVVTIFEHYQHQLQAASAVDFDDLILHVLRLSEDPDSQAGRELRDRFSFVLVDEFQDANPVQYRLVRALVQPHHNLCVVGDDDQSIYRWRGADVRIIRGFKKDFPEAGVIKLEHNYRSSANIVRGALEVIRPSNERQPKELYTDNPAGEKITVVAVRDERDEAAQVVSRLRAGLAEGISPRDIAVFYRIHAQSRVLEEAMRADNVPYQIIGGTKFFDRAEVKDVLAYLRVLANPRSDVDLMRIINVPARGIGDTTVERLVQAADRANQPLFDVLANPSGAGLSAAALKRVASVHALLLSLSRAVEHTSPHELAGRVLEETGYRQALVKEDTAEADARLENIAEFAASLQEYEAEAMAAGEAPTLSGYLERVALVNDADQMTDAPRVPMMTIHSAKGLEFSIVLLTGMEEDLFPYRSLVHERHDLEEERRLAYVALTRARNRLVITHAAARTIFGTTRYNKPSRFLGDLPQEVVDNTISAAMRGSLDFPRPSSGVHSSQPRPSRPPAAACAPLAAGDRYVERDHDQLPVDELFGVGAHVAHTQFGKGTVRAVLSGSGQPTVLVFFPGWGEKKIVVKFLRPA